MTDCALPMEPLPDPTLTADEPSVQRPNQVRVVVVAGPDSGKSVELTRGSALVGTHPDCHLVLTDRNVSRRHLSVELLERGVQLSDLGSKNGSRLLGAVFDRVAFPLGGTVDLGPSTSLTIVPSLSNDVLSDKLELGGMVGASVPMRRLFALMERLGATDTACLLVGETGTGKELAARTLHALSPRAKGPFVVVECGGLSASLATATLFGHARGAFTGAVGEAPGLLGAANGGTLFLDEVAALPLELQPLLLRALETRSYQRVGDAQRRQSDFRILAATRAGLLDEIDAGRFRADLYYRISAVTLELPPLRARLEDVPLLVHRFAVETGIAHERAQALLAAKSSSAWPGNVRELRNAVEATNVLGEAVASAAPSLRTESRGFHAAKEEVVTAFERSFLENLLKQHRGNLVTVAREAGIGRSHLYRLLEAHGLEPSRYR